MPADRTTAGTQAPWAQEIGAPSSGPSSASTAGPESPDSALAGLDALQLAPFETLLSEVGPNIEELGVSFVDEPRESVADPTGAFSSCCARRPRSLTLYSPPWAR